MHDCISVYHHLGIDYYDIDVDQFPIDAFNVLFLSICFCSNAVLIYIIQVEKPPRRRRRTSFYINRALRIGQLDKIDIGSCGMCLLYDPVNQGLAGWLYNHTIGIIWQKYIYDTDQKNFYGKNIFTPTQCTIIL